MSDSDPKIESSGNEPLRYKAGRKVQRHSPDRLLRQKLVLPGGITVSAEKHGVGSS